MEEKDLNNLENINNKELPEPEIAEANATKYTFTVSAQKGGTVSPTSTCQGNMYSSTGNKLQISTNGLLPTTYTATATTTGYYFEGWNPSGSGTVTANKTIWACFSNLYTVTISKADSNVGTIYYKKSTASSWSSSTDDFVSFSAAYGSTWYAYGYPSDTTHYSQGAQSSLTVGTSGNTMSVSVAAKSFTISVAASPAGGGTTAYTDHSVSGGGTAKYGSTVTVTATDGTAYKFKSWSDGGLQVHNATVDGDKTLTAAFVLRTYPVTYDENGYGTAPSAQTKTYGTDLTLAGAISAGDSNEPIATVTFDKNGGDKIAYTSDTNYKVTKHTQTSWNTKSDASGDSYKTGGTYSTEATAYLYAIWSHKSNNTGISFPTTSQCTRTGYDLLGFSTSKIATSADYNPGATVDWTTDGTIFYAVWQAQSRTVSFAIDPSGAGSISPSSGSTKVPYGTTYVASDTVLTVGSAKYTASDDGSGYSFVGWYIGSSKVVSGSITADTTFTAKFKLFTISLEVDPSYAGYFTNSSGTAITEISNIPNGAVCSVSGNILTVTSGTTIVGEAYAVSINDEKYGFDSWSGVPTIAIGKDYTVTANFSAAYKVTAVCRDHVKSITPSTAYGTKKTGIDFTATVDEGYTERTTRTLDDRTYTRFNNYNYTPLWSIYNDQGSGQFTPSTQLGLNINFKPYEASYIQALASATLDSSYYCYTITYDANGGSGSMDPSDSAHFASIPPSSTYSIKLTKHTFTRSNYVFTGWNTKADGSGDDYADEATFSNITTNTTLYAQWQSSSFTVTLDIEPDGYGEIQDSSGNVITELKGVYYGATTAESDNKLTFTKGPYSVSIYAVSKDSAKYKFKSWSNVPETITGEVTITAVFELKPLTITFKASPADWGTVDTDSITVTAGTTYKINTLNKRQIKFSDDQKVTASPVSSNYVFKWWVDESGAKISSGTITAATTFTARFLGYWVWPHTIAKGESISNLKADDWNSFTALINTVRPLAGKTLYSFTTVDDKTKITAKIFNEARSAIIDLPNYGSITSAKSGPSTGGTSEKILAAYFDGDGSAEDSSLRAALNRVIENLE